MFSPPPPPSLYSMHARCADWNQTNTLLLRLDLFLWLPLHPSPDYRIVHRSSRPPSARPDSDSFHQIHVPLPVGPSWMRPILMAKFPLSLATYPPPPSRPPSRSRLSRTFTLTHHQLLCNLGLPWASCCSICFETTASTTHATSISRPSRTVEIHAHMALVFAPLRESLFDNC